MASGKEIEDRGLAIAPSGLRPEYMRRYPHCLAAASASASALRALALGSAPGGGR
ncbi:MAG: hypothetical protein R2911_26400 [Caldilineaceae bacterium]